MQERRKEIIFVLCYDALRCIASDCGCFHYSPVDLAGTHKTVHTAASFTAYRADCANANRSPNVLKIDHSNCHRPCPLRPSLAHHNVKEASFAEWRSLLERCSDHYLVSVLYCSLCRHPKYLVQTNSDNKTWVFILKWERRKAALIVEKPVGQNRNVNHEALQYPSWMQRCDEWSFKLPCFNFEDNFHSFYPFILVLAKNRGQY